MDLESDLEDTLVAHPSMLLPNLKLVGRQTPIGGGSLDLLGVNDEGKLAVFELKRGTLSRDAVAQVIDYGSALNAMSESDLAGLISQNSGQHGLDKIEDFVEWYGEGFGGSLEALRPLRMYLVGLGTDDTTMRMVDFLSEHGVDISLLTFYGFKYAGKTLLAKQVQVAPKDEVSSGRSREELWRSLEGLARDLGVDSMMSAAREMFSSCWDEVIQGTYLAPRIHPRGTGMTYYLFKPTKAGGSSKAAFSSIEVDKQPKSIKVRFCPWAIDLCKESFDQLDANEMPFETRPSLHAPETDRVKQEILFAFRSMNEWEAHKGKLAELTRAAYAGYRELWELNSVPRAGHP